MKDITYCSHTDCYYRDCIRHQYNAPTDKVISVADLDDGFCFIPVPEDRVFTNRERLLGAVCRGIQQTHLKCDNSTRALCEFIGDCFYCHTIADAIEEAFTESSVK